MMLIEKRVRETPMIPTHGIKASNMNVYGVRVKFCSSVREEDAIR